MKNVAELKILLNDLRNVCIDENDCIDEPFRDWPVGTEIYEIWHDIEEKYDCCLGEIFNKTIEL